MRTRRNVLLAALGPAALVAGCSEPPAQQEMLRPVRTEQVYATGGSRVRTFSGTARAGQETDLSFRVSGRVQRVNVKVGDRVRRGQMIAEIEPRDFEIALRQAEAGLVQAEAASGNAGSDLERVRGLYENDNASKNDLDAALAADLSARAAVDVAIQAREAARRKLGYTRLQAPVEGSIATVSVEVNENVLQGKTVVRMTSGTRPEVEVAMPEMLISQIREGDPVMVTFDALPGTNFDAVVTEVGVAATGTATTFPVTARMTGTSPDVRSGMAANVAFRFEAQDDRERIHLPPQAVGEDRDGRFVFVLVAADEAGVGVVHRTPVVVGELTPDGLEVLDGLSEAQHVVTAGVRRLTDGQRVKLLDGGTGS